MLLLLLLLSSLGKLQPIEQLRQRAKAAAVLICIDTDISVIIHHIATLLLAQCPLLLAQWSGRRTPKLGCCPAVRCCRAGQAGYEVFQRHAPLRHIHLLRHKRLQRTIHWHRYWQLRLRMLLQLLMQGIIGVRAETMWVITSLMWVTVVDVHGWIRWVQITPDRLHCGGRARQRNRQGVRGRQPDWRRQQH